MEDKFFYMTPEQIEERKAKVAAIEGLAEIRAALADDKYTVGEIDELRAKYPRASVYLEAEEWVAKERLPIYVRLGSRAMEMILNDEDTYAVAEYMRRELDAFYMAQEG